MKDIRYGLRAEGASTLEQGSPYAVFLTMTSARKSSGPSRAGSRPAGARHAVVLPWGNKPSAAARAHPRRGSKAIVPPRMGSRARQAFVHARGVIGLDTGLTHLAAALGRRRRHLLRLRSGAQRTLRAPLAKNVCAGRAPEALEVLKQCA